MRGRIRQLKPDLFLDDEFWALTQERSDLPIFQGFLGLWCQVDREGRFEWKPAMLQTQILPYWRGSFEEVLNALAREGLITKYQVHGRNYGVIRSFLKHQRPGNREPKSTVPAPSESAEVCLSNTESAEASRASQPQPQPQPQPPEHARGVDPPSVPGLERVAAPEQPSETPTFRRLPKPWKPPQALYGEALNAGVPPEILDEDVTYWRSRDLGAEVYDFEEFFRSHFPRLRKRAETEKFRAANQSRAGPGGSSNRVRSLIDRANAMED